VVKQNQQYHVNNCADNIGSAPAIGHTFASNIRKVNSRLYITAIFLLICSGVFPQQLITVKEYIERYSDLAVEEMEKYRIPASITLAQGILESNSGNSALAREANNHFGIKCHKGWTGKTYHQDDDEKDECFRKYPSAEDSYRDHSEFLTTRDRYKLLFDLEVTDYKGWAHGLKQAGYATNPRYPDLLIRIIEENGLEQFDIVRNPQIAAGNRHTLSLSGPDEAFEIVSRTESGRVIFKNNGVKFIYAREGDDCRGIAAEFTIYTWQVFANNDMNRDDELQAGQKIYLERKKKRSTYDYHIVREGETIWSISQDYGIRMKALSRRNQRVTGTDLLTGETLTLK